MREPLVLKRFFSDTFAPPSGFHSDLHGPEVTAEEILAGGVRENDWSFPVLISTPSIDRQGDGVVPQGCDYSAFAASPIIFFDHQELKFPVGKMRGPDGRLYFCILPDKGILGRIWIRKPAPDDPSSYSEACATVWLLVRDGLLNGISAGFDPIGHVKELPTGGSLYKQWELMEVSIVPIAANRECRVIREPFAWDDAILKRFSPSVIKGIKTMTASSRAQKGEHHNTRDIKYENGKWVVLDNKTRKVLSRHDSREEALGSLRAIEFHKHGGGKSTSPDAQKGMTESSGSAGGYLASDEGKSLCGEIKKRMSDHDAEGHSLHFNPETGELHHSYPDSESEGKIKSIAGDLHDAPGVKSMTQKPDSLPEGNGYHKIYPEEARHESGVQKRHKQLSAIGKALFRMVQKRKLNGWIGKALEASARRIMPFLQKTEMEDKRAISVAWGIAGVKKGLVPLVVKDAADGDPDEDEDKDESRDEYDDMADDAATDAAMDVPEDEAAGGPGGLELVQTAIENLEAALPKLEPERRDFWAGIIEQIKKHGEETYPDEDFGGEDMQGKEAKEEGDNDADEQDLTNEMLSRYKAKRPMRVKRYTVGRVRKSLQVIPAAKNVIRSAANHLHGMHTLQIDPDKSDNEGVYVKGCTATHLKHCGIHGRHLDRLEGAITKEMDAAEGSNEGAEDGTVEKSHGSDAAILEAENRVNGVADRMASILGIRL